jgi:hypothetical protein
MNILPIDADYRLWLFKKNALFFDADLDERLAGLTHVESRFYIAQQEWVTCESDQRNEADLILFLTLHELHLAALGN